MDKSALGRRLALGAFHNSCIISELTGTQTAMPGSLDKTGVRLAPEMPGLSPTKTLPPHPKVHQRTAFPLATPEGGLNSVPPQVPSLVADSITDDSLAGLCPVTWDEALSCYHGSATGQSSRQLQEPVPVISERISLKAPHPR